MKFDSYNPAHFIAMTLIVHGVVVGLALWMLFRGHFGGAAMPDSLKIGSMIVVYIASTSFMISHRPKRPK